MKGHRKQEICRCGGPKSAGSVKCLSCKRLNFALCHPEKENEAFGLCRECYNKQRYRRRKAADPTLYARIAKRQHRKNPKRYLVTSAKSRAKAAQLPFDLTVADIEIPRLCPVLGIPLCVGEGGATDNSPSLDRIQPKLGYVRGNVVVISKKANTIKSFGTAEEHEKIAAYIRSHEKCIGS